MFVMSKLHYFYLLRICGTTSRTTSCSVQHPDHVSRPMLCICCRPLILMCTCAVKLAVDLLQIFD